MDIIEYYTFKKLLDHLEVSCEFTKALLNHSRASQIPRGATNYMNNLMPIASALVPLVRELHQISFVDALSILPYNLLPVEPHMALMPLTKGVLLCELDTIYTYVNTQ